MNDKQIIQTLIKILDTQLEYFVERPMKKEEAQTLPHEEYLFLNCVD